MHVPPAAGPDTGPSADGESATAPAPASVELGAWRLHPHFLIRMAGFPCEWLEELRMPEAARAAHALAAAESGEAIPAADLDRLREAAKEAFTRELTAARAAILRVARDDRFQEAVFLQSPMALGGSIAGLLRHGGGPRNHRARERERLVAAYLQRFCVKNESNSFFGPTGSGQVVAGEGLAYRFDRAVSGRQVYFTHWAAQALAAAMARQLPALDRPAAPPSLRQDGLVVQLTHEAELGDAPGTVARRTVRAKVGALGAALVERADGTRPRAALVDEAAASACAAPAEAAELLEALVEAGIVRTGPQVPSGHFDALAFLRAELERLPAQDGAHPWREALEAFRSDQQAFGAARDPERRAVLERMESRFTALTGQEARRFGGRQYADRGLLSEECASGVTGFGMGADLFTSGGGALDVLLQAVSLPTLARRWAARQWFAERHGRGPVPFVDAERELGRERASIERLSQSAPAYESLRRVRRCLEEAIDGSPAAEEVAFPTRQVAAAIDPAHLLEGLASHISVDVVPFTHARGGVGLVVGEVQTLFWTQEFLYWHLPAAAEMTRQRERLLRSLLQGMPGAEVVYRHNTKVDLRPPTVLDYELVIDGAPQVEAARSIRVADVAVTLDDGGFHFFAARSGAFVPVAVGALPIAFQLMSPLFPAAWKDGGYFPEELLPDESARTERPRIAADRVVLRRRQWRLEVGALRACLEGGPGLLGAARARARWRLPRRLFYRLPLEPKPMLVDLESQHLVELLLHHLAREAPGEHALLSEMLPEPEDLVLQGPDGRRTCEMRLCAWRRVLGGHDVISPR